MKIIHTSDWHLGHQLYKHDRDDEFEYAIRQLVEIVDMEQPDALVISGDIFDTPSPSTSAQQLYHRSLLLLHEACKSMPIVVIAGNHDGKSFLDVSKDLWQLANVHVIGLLDRKPQLEESDKEEPDKAASDFSLADMARALKAHYNVDKQIIRIPQKGYIVAIPHIYDAGYPQLAGEYEEAAARREHYFQSLLEVVNQENTENFPVVVLAHLALTSGDSGWHDWGSVGGQTTTHQSEFGSQYSYLALGHIHKQQTLMTDGKMARYCGSLIPVSFSETESHSVTIIDLKPGISPVSEDVRTQEISQLRPLRTMPDTPRPFKEVLHLIESIDPAEDCYLRLQVSITAESPLPPDAMAQVLRTLEGRKARFCEFKIVAPEKEMVNEPKAIQDPSQLREMTPVQVAQYAQSEVLPEIYKDMFDEVCARLNQGE